MWSAERRSHVNLPSLRRVTLNVIHVTWTRPVMWSLGFPQLGLLVPLPLDESGSENGSESGSSATRSVSVIESGILEILETCVIHVMDVIAGMPEIHVMDVKAEMGVMPVRVAIPVMVAIPVTLETLETPGTREIRESRTGSDVEARRSLLRFLPSLLFVLEATVVVRVTEALVMVAPETSPHVTFPSGMRLGDLEIRRTSPLNLV